MAITQTPNLTRRLAAWVRFGLTPDTVGPPECPILYRWTLFPFGFGSNSSSNQHQEIGGVELHRHKAPDWLPKLLLHHFVPQADERDFHDHPRGFLTLVLRGGYDDLTSCPTCGGLGEKVYKATLSWDDPLRAVCLRCSGTGIGASEIMRVGMLRYRPPEHQHRTRVHSGGAWTLVFMGPWRREWGFWRGQEFIEWKEYFKNFGYGMRCV